MSAFTAFFLDTPGLPGDQRLCVHHLAADSTAQDGLPRGRIVHVPPFAEEMNKSRRMVALQAHAFANAGYEVLRMDLAGCGDSSGDFADATWERWIDDVCRAFKWLSLRPGGPLWLWGLRAGCLLAAEAAQSLELPCGFLFWQPPAAGRTLLQQFMRVRLAGDMLSGATQGGMQALRATWQAGSTVQLAGYTVSPALAFGLERSVLRPPQWPARVECLELSTRVDAGVSPATETALKPWREAGHTVRTHVVNGPSFWQTAEIETAPALVAASLHALADVAGSDEARAVAGQDGPARRVAA